MLPIEEYQKYLQEIYKIGVLANQGPCAKILDKNYILDCGAL